MNRAHGAPHIKPFRTDLRGVAAYLAAALMGFNSAASGMGKADGAKKKQAGDG